MSHYTNDTDTLRQFISQALPQMVSCAITVLVPYRKIVHFGIQTAGFGDPLQTSQLTVCYADEHEMKFGFIGQEELLAVAKAISRCIL